ncbi:MAG TPA: hydrogenase formation protein HypD [Phycisphaerae bacterium]|nr:hydrogenase formation protein HypD [Phycisphaerae bacterium]
MTETAAGAPTAASSAMRDPNTDQLVERIVEASRRAGPVTFMEVCGTHTVALFRSGVRSLLPESVRLISGPGCPVCVTSQGYIDAACELASRAGVTICTYGDMLRVPGRSGSLEQQRACGAEVVVVYSARDAVRFAERHADRKVVFLAVGFETTAPGTAAAVVEAQEKGLENVFFLCGHKLVVPAMMTLLSHGDVPLDGFLCPGHVSVITGARAYEPIVKTYRKPCVVAGFEPEQLLLGICHLTEQVAEGRAELENVYGVAVSDGGNATARRWLEEVFRPAAAIWRAMGTIGESGLELAGPYRRFDALDRFELSIGPDYDPPGCRCGDVIQGKAEPEECVHFGVGCTPAEPIGPCMVSSEGTCAAWHRYGRGGVPGGRHSGEVSDGASSATAAGGSMGS